MDIERWLCLLIIAMVTRLGYSQAEQSCQIVDIAESRCLTEGAITIECPLNHIVIIKSVKVEVASVTTCPAGAGDSSCVLSDVTNQVRGECFFKKTCDLHIDTPTDRSMCPSEEFKATEYFVRLVYRCEALHNAAPSAHAMAICDVDQFTGSNINIDSTSLVFEGAEKIRTTGCTCSITVPPHTEVINSVVYLPPTGSCDQRIEIVDGGTVRQVCSKEPSNLDFGCRSEHTELTVGFVNDDPNTSLGFIVRFYTSHLANITIKCGAGAPISTTTSTTTTQSTTTPTTTVTSTTTTMPPTTTTTTIPPTTTTFPQTTTTTTIPPTSTTKTTTTIPPTTTTVSTTTKTPTTTTASTTTTPTSTSTTTTPSTTTPTATTSTTTMKATTTPATTVEEGATNDELRNEEDTTTLSGNETDVGEVHQSKRVIWPIIVGVVCAGILLLIIVCIIIGLRYRRDKEREVYVEPTDSDRGSQFTYVTGVYVEGNQQSKLVVKKPVKQMRTVLS